MSRPVLTESTSKAWKLIQLVSGISFIVGLVIFFSNLPQHNLWLRDTLAVAQANAVKVKYQAFGSGLTVMGLVGFIVGRIGAWWYHG